MAYQKLEIEKRKEKVSFEAHKTRNIHHGDATVTLTKEILYVGMYVVEGSLLFFLELLGLLARRLALYHTWAHVTFGGDTGDGFGVLALYGL